MFGLRTWRDFAREAESDSVAGARVSLSRAVIAWTSPAPSPEDPIGFARVETTRCGSVVRYRSATVAGLHGLPC